MKARFGMTEILIQTRDRKNFAAPLDTILINRVRDSFKIDGGVRDENSQVTAIR